LLTGTAAAEAIAADLDAPSEVAARYERDVHSTCSPTIACRSGSAGARPPAWRRAARSASSPAAGVGTAQLRALDVRGRAAGDRATPRRWHRRFLKQPGAYVEQRAVSGARGLRFVTGSIRSSGGASTSTPSTVAAKPSFSRSWRIARRLDRHRRSSLGDPR
jgi:hypothetical protein